MGYDASAPNTQQATLEAVLESVRGNDADFNSRLASIEAAGVVARANELAAARGNKTSLDGRLSVSIDDDGRLKFDSLRKTMSIASGDTPSYVSASSFTVPNDRTGAYKAGLLLRFTLTSGSVHAAVQASSFAAGVTTVTMRDAVLDATLAAVAFELAVLDREHVEIPAIARALATVSDIVDVVVYDTRKDSDRGAWRDMMERASWALETLDTASRGGRKGFPARALIVAVAGTTDELRIYDGDDPELALWKSWTITDPSHIEAAEGKLVVGTATGLLVLDLAADRVTLHDTSGRALANQSVATFDHTTAAFNLVDAAGAIVHTTVDALDIQRARSGPRDGYSGLAPLYIAVATTRGTSLLLPDGRVADSRSTASTVAVALQGDIIWTATAGHQRVAYSRLVDAIAGDGWRHWLIRSGDAVSTNSWNGVLEVIDDQVIAIASRATGHPGKSLQWLAFDQANPEHSMVAYAAIAYACGWLPGDCRLALAGDSAGEAVQATPMNEDGSTTDDWTLNTGWVHDAGHTRFDHTPGNAATLTYAVAGLVAGKTYVVETGVGNRTTGDVTIDIDGTSGGAITADGMSWSSFVATATTATLTFTPSSGFDGSIQSAAVCLAEPDRSAGAHAVRVIGTITKAAVETDAETISWSGFSAANNLSMLYDAAFDFGTGDLMIAFWLKENANAAVETIVRRDSAPTAGNVRVAVDASGNLVFAIDDDTTEKTITSGHAVDDSSWHFVLCAKRGNRIEIWIDGAMAATPVDVSAVGSLDNAAATLLIGEDQTSKAPLTNGSLALFRISAYAPTAAQIRRMYRDEVRLMVSGAKARIGGTSAQNIHDMTFDPETGRLLAVTKQGLNVFEGLVRDDFIDSSSRPELSSDRINAISGSGGVKLIGSSAEAVVVLDAVNVKERLAAPRPCDGATRRASSWRHATTDTTPTDVAKTPIAEGEAFTLRARVGAQEHRDVDGESAAWEIVGRFYRDYSGNVTQQGSTASVVALETTGSMDAAFTLDTTAQTIDVTVTGVASTTLAWTAEIGIQPDSEAWEWPA